MKEIVKTLTYYNKKEIKTNIGLFEFESVWINLSNKDKYLVFEGEGYFLEFASENDKLIEYLLHTALTERYLDLTFHLNYFDAYYKNASLRHTLRKFDKYPITPNFDKIKVRDIVTYYNLDLESTFKVVNVYTYNLYTGKWNNTVSVPYRCVSDKNMFDNMVRVSTVKLIIHHSQNRDKESLFKTLTTSMGIKPKDWEYGFIMSELLGNCNLNMKQSKLVALTENSPISTTLADSIEYFSNKLKESNLSDIELMSEFQTINLTIQQELENKSFYGSNYNDDNLYRSLVAMNAFTLKACERLIKENDVKVVGE